MLCIGYSIVQEDCESMARAYVNDISQFLDLANRENVKILAGKSLLWFEICHDQYITIL